MKNRRSPLLLPVVLISLVALPFAQQRVKKEAPDFKSLHAEISLSFEAGEYGQAMKQGKELLAILQGKWKQQILAALPPAPEGFELVPQKKDDPRNAGMMAAMAGAIGTTIEQKYKGEGRNITLTVQADSPMVQIFSMWVTNPSMLGPDAELIKYENGVSAVLKKDGSRYSLQVVLGSSLVEVKGSVSDEDLLSMLDQAAVNRLSAVLSI